MRRNSLFIVFFVLGCGGSSKPSTTAEHEGQKPEYAAEDFESRPELTRSELTTEVDERRYRAAAPPSTVFSASESIIYLVGKLKQIPTGASIEVRWFFDAYPSPVVISKVRGSSTFQFIASYQGIDGKFDRGSHTARVYVNNEEIGAVPFEIQNAEIESKGAKVLGMKFSKKVTKRNKPKRAKNLFQKGTKKIFVSFAVKRTDRGSNAEVIWTRAGDPYHHQNINMSGDRRYSAHIEAPEGLTSGMYKVDIAIDGRTLSTKTFMVGEPSSGPSIERIALGLEPGPSSMPKDSSTKFKSDCGAINCGLCFMDLSPNSVIELQWIQLDGDDEIVRYTNRTELLDGGEGTMGAAWEPDYGFESGSYKLVVLVNGEPLAEQPFEVE